MSRPYPITRGLSLTLTTNEAVETVSAALAQAAGGDVDGGAELLMPFLTSGVGTQYALACMLAETASHIARRDGVPGVSSPVEDMSPEKAFAYRFINAWANRDHASAETQFTALYLLSTGDGEQLRDGLMAVFHMAVATCVEMLAEERAAGTTGEEPVL